MSWISLCLGLLAWLHFPLPSQAASKHTLPNAADEVLSGRLYVRLAPGAGERLQKIDGQPVVAGLRLSPLLPATALGKLESRKRSADPERREALERLQRWLVAQPSDRSAWEDAWVRLQASSAVERVEPAYVHRISATPNDPMLGVQSHLRQLNATEGFDLVKGEQGDVVVGIVDGGSDWLHVDLAPNVHRRAGEIEGNGIDDDGNGFVDDVVGWNFPAGNGDPRASIHTPRNGNHGTHVAGIVGGVTDNGIGIASLGWNTQVLLVNAGAQEPGEDDLILHGYEGLVYAALHGADIVNASWGRSSQRWSDFEYDVLRALDALDVLIIAAAGNGITHQPFYPAFYPSVFSVTYADLNWELTWWANRDDWIEIAAPGTIWSTISGDEYRILIGSSQSAAAVSAVAASVLTLHPDYDAHQLRQHLRWTAMDLDALNPEDAGLIGSGGVDPVAAYSQDPIGLRISEVRPVRQHAPGGPEFSLDLRLHNELRPAESVSVHLESGHPSLILHETLWNGASMGAGEIREIDAGLSLSLADAAPYAEILPIRLSMLAGGRRMHQAFYFELRPVHMNLHAPRISMTHTANGRLAYMDPLRPRDAGGIGIRSSSGGTRVQTGSVLVAIGDGYVADALLELLNPGPFGDFLPAGDEAIVSREDGLSARSIHSVYDDSGAESPRGIEIEQSSWAFDDPGRDDFLLSRYSLRAKAEARADVRIGLLLDLEMGGLGGDESDRLHYLPEERILVARGSGDELFGIGVVVAPGRVAWNWLHDLRPPEKTERPYLYDASNFGHSPSDSDLYGLLSVSAGSEPSPSGGVAAVVSAGPFSLEFGERESFVVAYGFASDEASLIDAMRRARASYAFIDEEIPAAPPARVQLLGNVPNPFNPATEIRLALPEAGPVALDIFDLRGQLVRRLHRGHLAAGYHRIPWKGVDERGNSVASGVYFVSLHSAAGTASERITLIR